MRTAVVTGASRGIGRACALLFAQNGYHVIANYRKNTEAAESLSAEITGNGGGCTLRQADVSCEDEVKIMMGQVLKDFGRIDALVNNAGIASRRLFQEITAEEWDELFSVNVRGAFLCCKYAVPSMISKKRGSIVNISSVWGVTGASMEVAYSASKAALIGFTRALAKELGPSGIRVNCIAPGVIETDMNGNLSAQDLAALREETPLMRLGTPRDIAESALFFSSEKASFLTGQVLGADGGFGV